MPGRIGRCNDVVGIRVRGERRAASIRQLSLLESQMLLTLFSWLVEGYFSLAVQCPPTSQVPCSPVLLV